MKLTDTALKNMKPKERIYRKSDGHGLYIEVYPNGSKYWRMKYRHNGVCKKTGEPKKIERRLSFGVYPEVSLSEARERREEARTLIRNGQDPALVKKQQKLAAAVSASNTFETITRLWHEHNKPRWSEGYAVEVLHRMEKDIFPELGAYPIADIKAPLILKTVRKIEARGAHDIARRALQCIGQVFRYAIGEGKAESDPTRDLKGQLKPFKKSHYAALDIKDMPEFLGALERNEARLYAPTRRAMKLIMLTFTRTSELIQAKWEEIDFQRKLWTIPAERMKMNKDHIVPLSRQALEILEEQYQDTGQWEWVFPNQVRPKKPMSNNTILMALKRMGYGGVMTGHGFRALARTAIRERLGYDSEVIEKQLAHKTTNPLGEAYDRTQFIEERIPMLQDWADFLEALAQPNVVQGNFGKRA